MLPSLDPETNSINIHGSSTQPNKKSTSAGVQGQTKNGRKNGTAKDSGGGVLAAVTRNNASKMNSKSPATSSRIQSPDTKVPVPTPNETSVTSPLLDALSSAALAQSTTEWAKNVPAYSSSPSNLINLGESPPTIPSSYEDRLATFGWTAREQRGIPNGHPPSVSPPTSQRRRPLSYHTEGNHMQSSPDDHRPQGSVYAARRSSMYSQYSSSRYGAHGPQPPLPHQAQAHFYGAPDANLLLSPQRRGLCPGDNGYYCGFDNLHSSQDMSKTAENVVVAGYEGGLDIYAISKRGLSKVYKIDGLRGGVYNAKILPPVKGERSGKPALIAVVVHGPVWFSSDIPSDDPLGGASNGDLAPQAGNNRSPAPKIAGQSLYEAEGCEVEYFQTTVEVYNLHTKQHVATLLNTPKTHIAIPISSPLFRTPPPAGALTIRANSGNVIIASGISGETWIFSQSFIDDSTLDSFKCTGKVWTSIQHGLTVEPNGLNGLVDGDWQPGEVASSRQQDKASILSLNGRWLAYCPSFPSSQISIRAVVPSVSATTRIPGLNTQAPPQLPSVNCQVEKPGDESTFMHIAQIATQEALKSAQYVGDKGVKLWKNYWNPPAAIETLNGGPAYLGQATTVHQFPPTHGLNNQAPAAVKDPGLIAILDLDYLAHHGSSVATSPHPLATFMHPHGCSFLSFSPSGLALFVANSKGDVQSVWDLMRIQYAKPSFLKSAPSGSRIQGPHVRQIAQFSRMTTARIVDVVWTSPHGERAVMVTEPGTVHVLDLPASAFTWPPPRRKIASTVPSNEGTESALSVVGGVASGAFSSVVAVAQPYWKARRRSSSGISAITAANVTSQAGHGTHALAAGISRSVGAATGKMNEYRKSSGKKLHLPQSSVVPSRACIRLISGRRNDTVLVVGGGVVGLFTIKSRRADLPADKQKASKGAKYVEFKLPFLPDFKVAPEPIHGIDPELTINDNEQRYWKANQPRAKPPIPHGTESSIPQAEIESNSPYQPFHTDRRVALHYYTYEKPLRSSPSVSALLSPVHQRDEVASDQAPISKTTWSFGGLITTGELNVGPPQDTEDSLYSLSDYRALPSSAIERVLKFPDNYEGEDRIVSTTRPRKGACSAESAADLDEDGFFEVDAMFLDFASQRV